MVTTGGTGGLAEGIIDDTCFVFVWVLQLGGFECCKADAKSLFIMQYAICFIIDLYNL